MDYLRARYYDSHAGTFLTQDTYQGSLTNPLSQNLYAYVQNNPLNYTDPSGHFLNHLGNMWNKATKATKAVSSFVNKGVQMVKSAVNAGQARATPKEHHDGIVEHLVDNLRELENDKHFDEIQIYQRNRRCVYDSEIDDGPAQKCYKNTSSENGVRSRKRC